MFLDMWNNKVSNGVYIRKEEGSVVMKKSTVYDMVFRFMVRAFSGMAIVYFVNLYIGQQGMMVKVGMNPISFLTSGILGLPGLAMLYGISFYQIL